MISGVDIWISLKKRAERGFYGGHLFEFDEGKRRRMWRKRRRMKI